MRRLGITWHRRKAINWFTRGIIVDNHGISNTGWQLLKTRLQPVDFVARRMKRNEQQQELARSRNAGLIETSQARRQLFKHRRTPSQGNKRLQCSHQAGAADEKASTPNKKWTNITATINAHLPSELFDSAKQNNQIDPSVEIDEVIQVIRGFKSESSILLA